MKEFFEPLKYVFRWPSIAFWITIVAQVAGLFASNTLYIIKMRRFPSIVQTASNSFSGPVFKAFTMIAAPFLAVVCYKTTRFIQKIIKVTRNKRTDTETLSKTSKIILLYYGHVASSTILPVALITFAFTKSVFLCVLFFISLFAFHLTSDLIYAICTDTMIRFAWISNLVVAGLSVVIVFGRFIAFVSGNSKFVTQLSNVAMTLFVSISFFRFIFTGILVLGARFIDSSIDVFKKEKQTIVDESYGLV
jgi:hypothetical protein